LSVNPLNAELNPICHMLALLGAHPILHVSRMKPVEQIVTYDEKGNLVGVVRRMRND